MRWTYANTRPALILRRRLARLGIGLPRVALRAQWPWHVRAAGLLVLVATGAIAGVVFDAQGWFRQGAVPAEEERLRLRIVQLEQEVASLRAASRTNGSTSQIERAVQEQLSLELRSLQMENGRLREELAFFENLASTGGTPGLSINRLHVEPEAIPGQYRYRLLAILTGGRKEDREFDGNLQLIVTYVREGERVNIVLPDPSDPRAQDFALRFRHFQRLDGSFKIPDGAKPSRVEARLVREGATRASQSVDL